MGARALSVSALVIHWRGDAIGWGDDSALEQVAVEDVGKAAGWRPGSQKCAADPNISVSLGPSTSIYEASERDFRVVLARDAVSGRYRRASGQPG